MSSFNNFDDSDETESKPKVKSKPFNKNRTIKDFKSDAFYRTSSDVRYKSSDEKKNPYELEDNERYRVLTFQNFDDSCLKAVMHLDPYINKFAYKLNNSLGTIKDYKQELIAKALQVFRHYEFEMTVLRENATIDDLIGLAIRVIHNRFADLSMSFSKRPDTSLFQKSIDEIDDTENSNMSDKILYKTYTQMNPNSTIENAYENVEYGNLINALIKHLEYSEMPYETVNYVKETINPSDSTEKRYEKWLEVTNPKNPHKNKGIPAKVICEELGIEYSKMGKIKEIIAMTMVKIGFDPVVINRLVTTTEDTWKQYGLKQPKDK